MDVRYRAQCGGNECKFMRIETRTIKKVLYRIDPEAPKDKEFIEQINMILLLMEQEQKRKDQKNGR